VRPTVLGWARLRRISRFLVVFAVLQVLDLATTLLLLSIGGIEANPSPPGACSAASPPSWP